MCICTITHCNTLQHTAPTLHHTKGGGPRDTAEATEAAEASTASCRGSDRSERGHRGGTEDETAVDGRG